MVKCPVCGNKIKASICEECGYDNEHDYSLHQLSHLLSDKEVEKYHAKIILLKKIYQKNISKQTKIKDVNELFELASSYHYGSVNIKKDYQKAIQYYQEAAKLNHAGAMYNLAYMYRNGIGIKQDIEKAQILFDKAVEIHNLNEQKKNKQLSHQEKSATEIYNLACNYHYGDNGLKQNYQKAVQYYQEAVKLNHSGAMYNLGCMYNHGIGVTKDLNKAQRLFIKAKEIRSKK